MNSIKPRPIGIIKNQIEKLQEELKEATNIAKAQSAVHVLENLGWKHNGKTWVKPMPQPQSKGEAISMYPYKAPSKGDLALYRHSQVPVYVHAAFPNGKCLVSHFTIDGKGRVMRLFISAQKFTTDASALKVRPREYFAVNGLTRPES